MALTAPTLAQIIGLDSSALSKSTAAFSPAAGTVVYAVCAARKSVSGTPAPVLSISNSHAGTWSWTKITVSDSASTRHTLSAWCARVPASAGFGTVSFTSDVTVNRWELGAWWVSGAQANFDNSITKSHASDTTCTLLTAPAASSQVHGVIAAIADTDGVTLGTGFTLIGTTAGDTSTTLQAQYDATTPGTGVAWTGSDGTSNLMIAWEVKTISGGAIVTMIGA